ncbi:MAG: hypothetical protein AB8F74_18565 [Saprospiraceae bacterium]
MKNAILLSLLCLFFACQQSETKQSSPTPDTKAESAKPSPPQGTATVDADERKEIEDQAIKDLKEASKGALENLKFKSVAMEMDAINYKLRNYKEKAAYKTNLNIYVKSANEMEKYNVDTIDMTGVNVIKRIFIKGTQPTKEGGDTYPRADIENWECKDEATAKAKVKAINKLKKSIPWDVISKSPITYWQDGRSVYLLTPGGMYMLNEVPKIKGFLEKRM